MTSPNGASSPVGSHFNLAPPECVSSFSQLFNIDDQVYSRDSAFYFIPALNVPHCAVVIMVVERLVSASYDPLEVEIRVPCSIPPQRLRIFLMLHGFTHVLSFFTCLNTTQNLLCKPQRSPIQEYDYGFDMFCFMVLFQRYQQNKANPLTQTSGETHLTSGK